MLQWASSQFYCSENSILYSFIFILQIHQQYHCINKAVMRKFLSSTSFSFCLNNRLNRIYDITFQIKDVSLIKGFRTKKPYIQIEDKKVELPKNLLVFQLNKDLKPEEYFRFLDRDLNEYHPTTPLKVICSQVFYVRKNNNVYCILNNIPMIFRNRNQVFDPTQCSQVVESLCKSSIQELPDNPEELISGPAIHNILVTNLLREGMAFKIDKIRMKELLKVVNRQIQKFQEQIRQLEYSLKRRANRTLKYFTSFLAFQYLIMHYYIYVHLSWDIMEPITVIFGNIDLFVGYLFFVLRGRDWSLGQVHGSIIDQNKYNILKKNGINVQKYEQLLKIREYINLRLALLSKNPFELMEALEKPINLLDTK